MKKQLSMILPFLIMVLPVLADNDAGFERGGDGGFAGGLGNFAVFLLAVGAVYVALRVLYVWSKSWPEDYEEWKTLLKDLYRQYRKPLLTIHNWMMIAAVVVGGIHGIFLLSRGGFQVITGIVAWGIMLFLAIFGTVIYYKMRPIWDKREVKGFVRFVHRQWILSIILIIALLIHVGIN